VTKCPILQKDAAIRRLLEILLIGLPVTKTLTVKEYGEKDGRKNERDK
jgi:hypothetical protein